MSGQRPVAQEPAVGCAKLEVGAVEFPALGTAADRLGAADALEDPGAFLANVAACAPRGADEA